MMLKNKWIGASLALIVFLCGCDANQVEVPPSEAVSQHVETIVPVQETETTPVEVEPVVEESPEPTGPVMLEEIVGLIPECEPVDETWFKDAVFIGDSRTDGLRLYGGIKGAKYFSSAGLSVFSIDDKECITLNGEKVTVLEALSHGEFKKVFVMLGINEIGYKDLDMFKQAYTDLILQIKELHPEADIYIQLQPPANETVAKAKKNYAHVTNERILLFNELIAEVAEEQQTALLDIWDALANENDELPSEVTADGVHMIRAGYLIWADYLRSHTGATPLVPERPEEEVVTPTETPTETPAPSQSVQSSDPVSSAPVATATPAPSAVPVPSTTPAPSASPAPSAPVVSESPVSSAPVETVTPSQPAETSPVESTVPVESASPEVSAPVESAPVESTVPGEDAGLEDDPEAVIGQTETGGAE